MRNQLLLLFTLLFICISSFAQDNRIKLFKELYTDMSMVEVDNYLINVLKSKKEKNGDYPITFLNENAYLKPVFEDGKLKKIQILFENDDIENIQRNLKHIEAAFQNLKEWKEYKTNQYVWLFQKKLPQEMNQMNYLSVYSLGIFHDEVGSSWHSIIYISPKTVDDDKINNADVEKKEDKISSDL